MKNLIKKIQNTIFQHCLFTKGDKIVLGVSGGPDSVFLLDIFAKLAPKYDLKLLIAHINYGLRGKDSDRDEKFVRELAKKYGLEIFVLNCAAETQNFASLRKGMKSISENFLRDIRYDFFEKIRKENKFDLIAVAHNADDQAETFLMRVIRGAGMDGLSAMRYKNKRIIRPILEIFRAEIEKYLKENRLKSRIDKTNRQNDFLRNKIRNKLIPKLQKNYNPRIKQTIFDSVISIAEDQAWLAEMTDKFFKKITGLKISELEKLPPALSKRIIRKFIAEKLGNVKNIDASHIEEILKIIKSAKNKNQTVSFKGLKITRKGDKLEISVIINHTNNRAF